MSPDPAQRDAALKNANAKRTEIADVRRRARRNPQFVVDTLMAPPECVHHITVLELLTMARVNGMRADAIEHVGGRAVEDDINLLVPLGRASTRTRYWACVNGLEWVQGRSRIVLPEPPPTMLGEVKEHPSSPYRPAVAA